MLAAGLHGRYLRFLPHGEWLPLTSLALCFAADVAAAAQDVPAHAPVPRDIGAWTADGALALPRHANAVGSSSLAHERSGSVQQRMRGFERLHAEQSAPLGAMELALGDGCDAGWLPTFGGIPGTNAWAMALCAFDDGSGPALYAGGYFTSGGGVSVGGVARWDGTDWSALDEGPNFDVFALTVWDDGSGPALFAGGVELAMGGNLGRVARWDGSTWTNVGPVSVDHGLVYTLCGVDGGAGRGLYAGGRFTSIGGVAANNIAIWDGSAWNALAQGVVGLDVLAGVNDMCVADDGAGPALFVGGNFHSAGGQPANQIAKWDGANWSALGSGVSSSISPYPEAGVFALVAMPRESGPGLYVGGQFDTAGGVAANGIALWESGGWSALPQEPAGVVTALQVAQESAGPVLYAGGGFLPAGGPMPNYQLVSRWDGTTWSPLTASLGSAPESGATFFIAGLVSMDLGSGPRLFAAGGIPEIGGLTVKNVVEWDGSSWSGLGSGLTAEVRALGVVDVGSGAALYAGGNFTAASGLSAKHIARWDGSAWTPFGQGVNGSVRALAEFDDGSGPALYAGGYFTEAGGLPASRIARWDGSAWSPLGLGTNGVVLALQVHDDGTGPALYAGGGFTAAGGQVAHGIARWNGSAWSGLPGAGVGTNAAIEALCTFDDGTGSALYVGGSFVSIGGVPANSIARWDGQGWSALGTGVAGSAARVASLCVFDDGAGDALYAGGSFTSAGGVPANRIARWDGSAWSGLGSDAFVFVHALAAVDDGSGPALFAGGSPSFAAVVANASRIVRWDGASWSSLGSGLKDEVYALVANDAGPRSSLYVGGRFTASPGGDSYVAEWAGCVAPGFDLLAGCFANPASLGSPSAGLVLGGAVVFDIQSQAGADGVAFLHVAPKGVDTAGCGLFVPGLGELLVAVVPQPILVAAGAAPLGQAQFQLPIPNQPQLAGLELTFQGAIVSLALPGFPLELSNALAASLKP